jgi:hypothetical protein
VEQIIGWKKCVMTGLGQSFSLMVREKSGGRYLILSIPLFLDAVAVRTCKVILFATWPCVVFL